MYYIYINNKQNSFDFLKRNVLFAVQLNSTTINITTSLRVFLHLIEVQRAQSDLPKVNICILHQLRSVKRYI